MNKKMKLKKITDTREVWIIKEKKVRAVISRNSDGGTSIASRRFAKKLQCGDPRLTVPVKNKTLQLNRLGKAISPSYKKCRAYTSDVQYYLSLGKCTGGACWRGKYDKGAMQKAAALGSYEACSAMNSIYSWYPEGRDNKKATYWLYRKAQLALADAYYYGKAVDSVSA